MSFEMVAQDREAEWYMGCYQREEEEGAVVKNTDWSLLHESETEDYEDALDDGWTLKGWVGESREEKEKQKVKKSLKHRVMSAWMNAKYTWAAKVETDFKEGEIIWMCGRYYKDYESLCSDFHRIPWFTYRSGFASLGGGEELRSDVGWGCMVRSGQMGLALALKMKGVGRNEWISEAGSDDDVSIIRLFGDLPLDDVCPLSLHSLVGLGHVVDKPIGQWYGPASIAVVIRKAIHHHRRHSNHLRNLLVYIAPDSTIYLKDLYDLYDRKKVKKVNNKNNNKFKKNDDVNKKELNKSKDNNNNNTTPLNIALPTTTTTSNKSKKITTKITTNIANTNTTNNNTTTNNTTTNNTTNNNTTNNTTTSILILIPLRLGGEGMNGGYREGLKGLFRLPCVVGVLGGRPRHSVFFVGAQGNHLIYLDPHQCQDVVDVTNNNFSTETFHTQQPLKMSMEKIDPSCCVVMLCRGRREVAEMVAMVRQFEERLEDMNKALLHKRGGGGRSCKKTKVHNSETTTTTTTTATTTTTIAATAAVNTSTTKLYPQLQHSPPHHQHTQHSSLHQQHTQQHSPPHTQHSPLHQQHSPLHLYPNLEQLHNHHTHHLTFPQQQQQSSTTFKTTQQTTTPTTNDLSELSPTNAILDYNLRLKLTKNNNNNNLTTKSTLTTTTTNTTNHTTTTNTTTSTKNSVNKKQHFSRLFQASFLSPTTTTSTSTTTTSSPTTTTSTTPTTTSTTTTTTPLTDGWSFFPRSNSFLKSYDSLFKTTTNNNNKSLDSIMTTTTTTPATTPTTTTTTTRTTTKQHPVFFISDASQRDFISNDYTMHPTDYMSSSSSSPSSSSPPSSSSSSSPPSPSLSSSSSSSSIMVLSSLSSAISLSPTKDYVYIDN